MRDPATTRFHARVLSPTSALTRNWFWKEPVVGHHIGSENARALRHFLKVRGSIEGDSEMRTVSAEILKRVSEEAPNLFADFSVESLADGSPIVRHEPLGVKEMTRFL